MNISHNRMVLKTVGALLQRGLITMRQTLPDKIINHLVWTTLNLIVFSYIMPSLGLAANYGAFIALSMPVSSAFFGAINCMYGFLYDVTNEGSNLRYELTLPIPQWATFAKHGVEIALQTFFATSILFPICFIMVYGQIPFSPLAILKFYIALFATSCFSGAFALCIVALTTDILQGLDNIWQRVIFPMWFLGCFQFAWHDLYKLSPTLAYLNLLNPLTYALESSRASMVFEQTSLPFWLCITMLGLFTILLGYVGIQKLKKRMDCL